MIRHLPEEPIATSTENVAQPVDTLSLAALPCDDLGHAMRLKSRFGDCMVKTSSVGWICYSAEGGRWFGGAKGEALARRRGHDTARALDQEYHAAKQTASEGKDQAFWESKALELSLAMKRAGNANSTTAILKQAESYLEGDLKDFDPDPNLIGLRNGTLSPRLINAPCFVAYNADGVVEAYVEATKVYVDGPQITLAGWQLKNMGDDVIQIVPPSGTISEAVDLADLKSPHDELGGLERNGYRLIHRLYHQELELLPHTPGHKITRQAAVNWNPKATCPKWREHMRTVLPDKSDRDFFHRAMGYGLFGSNRAQCFLFLQGKGGDGKSTTMKVIVKLMGDYHHTCDPKVWIDGKVRSSAEASPDMADMAGDTRLAYCEEPTRGARLNEALIKQVTGGLDVRARQLNRDLFDYEPRYLPVVGFNDPPRIVGGDDGIWRRVRLISFPHQFPENDKVEDIVERLLEEREGIFNWLLEGLAAFHKFGLKPHQRMKDAIAGWRATSDPFGEWFRDRCVTEFGAKESTSVLYDDYTAYMAHHKSDGRDVLGYKAFQNRLSSLQINPVKGDHGARLRAGVRLKPQEEWMKEAMLKKNRFDD